MRRAAITVLLLLGAVFACGQAYQHTSPVNCPYADKRLCRGRTHHALLSVLAGGPSAGQIATGGALTGVTVTRSGAVLCQNQDGGFNSVATNHPCVEPKGLIVRPATQVVSYETDSLARWSTDHASVDGGVLAPDGTSTAVVVTANTDNSAHELYSHTDDQGPGWYTCGIWAKAGTANFVRLSIGGVAVGTTFDLGAGFIANQDGTHFSKADGSPYSNVFAGPDGWFLLQVSDNDSLGGGYIEAFIGDTFNHVTGTWAGTGAETVKFWGATCTSTQDPRPVALNSNASTLTTRAADVATATNALSASDTKWCIGVNATPDYNFWDNGLARGLFQLGATAGAANTASLKTTGTGALVFSVVDAAGDAKTITSTTTLWAGTRFIRACDNAGALSFSMDARTLTGTASGTGTGIIGAMPGTAYLGSLGATGQLGGALKDVCLDKGATSCPVQPRSNPVPRSLYAIGDSLTAAGPAGVSYWPELLAAAVPSWSITNGGHGSWSIVDYWHSWLGLDTPHPVAGRVYQVITSEGGINDSPTPAAEVFYWHKLLWDTADASGAQVVVFRESPWAGSTSSDAARQARYATLQASVASWCASTGHVCIDEYTAMADGVDPTLLACAYDYGTDGTDGCINPNGSHLNQAGQSLKLAQVRGALGI